VSVRIGAGAGFAGDRLEPAIDLVTRGNLDFLVLECLAERTIAAAQLRRKSDSTSGFDPMLERRMRALLPVVSETGTRIITNMGAANPRAAAVRTQEIAQELGLDLDIACVTGDDVLELIDPEAPSIESGLPLRGYGELISANAYLGVDAILPALRTGAEIVITGRVADASLFLAPLVYRFGWTDDDQLATGIAVGHLLECAGQLCGGYYADPGKKDVPGLARLGFPFAVVDERGTAVFSKLPGTGGIINRATTTEQLLYEVADPGAYLTPDVMVDFTNVEIDDLGSDRVGIRGVRGMARPEKLKVSVGYLAGYVGEGEISYAATNAPARARLAGEIVRERLRGKIDDLRSEVIGITAMHGNALFADNPYEVRVRVAGRAPSARQAEMIGDEVLALYTCGPAGGGGVRSSVREQISIVSTLVDRAHILSRVEILRAHTKARRAG